MKNIASTIGLFILLALPTFSQKNVVITVLDQTKGATGFWMYQESKIRSVEFYERKEIGKKHVLNDSAYTIVIESLISPQIIDCQWLNSGKKIMITPGDSIKALIKYEKYGNSQFKVIFFGKNEGNYNTYSDFKLLFDQNSVRLKAQSVPSLKSYIQIIDSVYIENTAKIKNGLKPSFVRELILEEEKLSIFRCLDYAVSIRKESMTWSEIINLKNKYFPQKIGCKDLLYMQSSEYIIGMDYLRRFLCMNIQSENRLMAETDTVKKYFEGELRDYLLSDTFRGACRRSKKQGKIDPDLDKWYGMYYGKMKENEYNKYILYTYENFKKINIPFPEAILNEVLISLTDSSFITVRDLLAKNKGAQIIIDNWASWCGPCAHEIKIGRNNIQELEKRDNHFIYFSMDKFADFKKAKDKAIELGIIDKAYIISGSFNSAYAKCINVTSIPRYVMIDKLGNLKNLDLRYPSSIVSFDEYMR